MRVHTQHVLATLQATCCACMRLYNPGVAGKAGSVLVGWLWSPQRLPRRWRSAVLLDHSCAINRAMPDGEGIRIQDSGFQV